MAKKRKNKPVKPDEFFAKGPLRVARYGSSVLMETNWPEGAHAEMQKRSAAEYPEIVKQINQLVNEIAKLVSELPPEKLLHRAWWELAVLVLKAEAESDLDHDDSVAMRMIDYIQSVIASVKPSPDQREDLTDEEWDKLRDLVDQLFGKVNLDYQICRTAKKKAEDENYNDNLEDYYFKAQLYWCNVRGNRYQVHMLAYLRELFLPHTDVLAELFGITADQFVDELSSIWHSQTFGIGEAFEEMEAFQKDSMAAVEEKLKADSSLRELPLEEIIQKVILENGWQKRQVRVLGRVIGSDLCNVEKITSLPKALIDELTWEAGEDTEFFADGDFRGWPLRIWPVFKRPLIRLDGQSYCFDLHGLFDNIYRGMERIIMRLKPDYRQTWNNIQKNQSETLPFQHLEKLLPGATIWRSVNYRWFPSESATTKDWCEVDGLLVYDNRLFVIEVKAGAFTYTSPANDFPAFISSLENLVLKPAAQGKRFLNYLDSAENIPLFNQDREKVGELRKSDFEKVVICPVTLDPFTEMAAQIQHLRKIGVDVGSAPVWAISLDDLRVYADIFENPLRFLHYVDERMLAFKSELIELDDELDHLGLYLKHNNYSLYAKEMQGASGAQMHFTGYRTEIDKFFNARLLDPSAPCPLKQDTPSRIIEIIDKLAASAAPARATLSGYLLDLDSETRKLVAASIEQEILSQPENKRPKPFSTHGDVALTAFCYTDPWVSRDTGFAEDHAKSVLLINDEKNRLLLELSYSQDGVLTDVNWEWIAASDISPTELPRLKENAEKLRSKRISSARARKRNIGRNEPCPCGSGKKYKKCCIRRM